MRDLVLPSFQMDCRDWLVSTPEEVGLLDDVGDGPVLAVLSTAVFGTDSFSPARGVLTVGLLDDDVEVQIARSVHADSPAAALPSDDDDDCLRFVLPAPSGPLALLAEFTLPEGHDPDIINRVESLMRSFRWAA